MLVVVLVALPNVLAVQAQLEECCSKTGDSLLSRFRARGSDEAAFVVLLMEKIHLSTHLRILDQALQGGAILGFQIITYQQLVPICCPAPLVIREQLQQFPRQASEFWFPDITSEQQGYIFMRNEALSKEQSEWLRARQVQRDEVEISRTA
jgi:hypothetical protein